MPNLNYDIYTQVRGFSRRDNADPTKSITLLNNSGSDIRYGTFVMGDVGTRTMDGSTEAKPIGYMPTEYTYEENYNSDGNVALANNNYGDAFKEGTFEVYSVSAVNSGDSVYVVNDPSSPDNGLVRASANGNAILLENCRFEDTTSEPGYVSIALNLP